MAIAIEVDVAAADRRLCAARHVDRAGSGSRCSVTARIGRW